MIQKEFVQEIVESYINGTSYYLVDIKISTDNRIAVEIDHFDGVCIDYCIDLTREIESKLDRDIEDYELTVSSAGLTEPFKILKQYEKNLDKEIEVVTKDGQKLLGILKAVNPNFGINLEIEKQIKPEGAKRKVWVSETIEILFDNIKTSKYHIRFK